MIAWGQYIDDCGVACIAALFVGVELGALGSMDVPRWDYALLCFLGVVGGLVGWDEMDALGMWEPRDLWVG